MLHVRTPVAVATLASLSILATAPVASASGTAATDPSSAEPSLSATLDSKPIPLAHVGRYYCDDFSYPVITCSRSPVNVEQRASAASLAAAIDYTTIYDYASFAGAYMHVTQDYNALSMIGWNDRIGSFRGKNGETGTMYRDWFYGGLTWNFCCNAQYGSLLSWDNAISSIRRT